MCRLSFFTCCTIINSFRYTVSDEQASKTDDLKEALVKYTQSVLDSTYFQECALTEANFREEGTFSHIVGIIQALSLPAELCGGVEQVVEMLGADILECLYWRVGALLYMYCHHLYEEDEEEKERRPLGKDFFFKVSLKTSDAYTNINGRKWVFEMDSQTGNG